jgi:hypothetical protein
MIGCHHDSKKLHHKKHKKSLNKDTLFITKRSAVSVWLDSTTMEKRRKQYGNDDSDAAEEDNVYYAGIADSILKSKGLPVIDAQNYKYLKFMQHNGISTVVKIDTLPQFYTLYLFDPSKSPHEADIAEIDVDYKIFYR